VEAGVDDGSIDGHPPRQTSFVGQRDAVSGPPSRSTVALASVVAAALMCGVALLALPGDPMTAWSGLEESMQDARVLVPASHSHRTPCVARVSAGRLARATASVDVRTMAGRSPHPAFQIHIGIEDLFWDR
jgi:hypothetical protein